MSEQAGGVVRGLLEGKRPIGNVGGVPVPLLLKGDDLPIPCKGRQNLSEGGLNRRSAAVKKYQGWNLAVGVAVYLVIHLQPVHRRVAALHGRWLVACRRCATQAEDHNGAQGAGDGVSVPDHGFRSFRFRDSLWPPPIRLMASTIRGGRMSLFVDDA